MLLTAQTKGQLELDVILRAAGRGLGKESVRGRGRGQARKEGDRQRTGVRQRQTYKDSPQTSEEQAETEQGDSLGEGTGARKGRTSIQREKREKCSQK